MIDHAVFIFAEQATRSNRCVKQSHPVRPDQAHARLFPDQLIALRRQFPDAELRIDDQIVFAGNRLGIDRQPAAAQLRDPGIEFIHGNVRVFRCFQHHQRQLLQFQRSLIKIEVFRNRRNQNVPGYHRPVIRHQAFGRLLGCFAAPGRRQGHQSGKRAGP